MAVHRNCEAPALLIQWLRDECVEDDFFVSGYDAVERFTAWLDAARSTEYVVTFTFTERFHPVTGSTLGFWENPSWMQQLFRQLDVQREKCRMLLTRDVVLDTLLDIAYPVEARRSHAEAVHAGL